MVSGASRRRPRRGGLERNEGSARKETATAKAGSSSGEDYGGGGGGAERRGKGWGAARSPRERAVRDMRFGRPERPNGPTIR